MNHSDFEKSDKLDLSQAPFKPSYHVYSIRSDCTVILEDNFGEKFCRFEREISRNRELLNKLSGENAHDIGYRVGVREGMRTYKEKMKLVARLKKKQSLIRKIFRLARLCICRPSLLIQ